MPAAAATPTTDAEVLDDKGAFSGEGSGNEPKDKGKPAAKADPAPVRVKVRIGAEELETDEASAAAINSILSVNQQLVAQMQGYTRVPDNNPKPQAYDYSVGLFTEPAEALKRLRAEIKADIVGEVSGAYNAAESKKEFWKGFYEANSDLKDEKFIVESVLARDFQKLKDVPAEQAAKKIAEAAKKEIMRLSGGRSQSDDSRPLEGGSNGNKAQKAAPADDGKVLSLSQIIRNRQEARRKATFSKE